MARDRDLAVVPDTSAIREKALRRSVRAYFRAVDDRSWDATRNWHKRHDKDKAEATLRKLVGMEQE